MGKIQHQENVEPLVESDLKEEFEQELLIEDTLELEELVKKVHEGGEPELPPEEPLEQEEHPNH